MKLVLGLSLLSFAVLAGRAEAQVLCTLGTAPAGYESLADMPASASAQADLRKLKAALCPKGCGKVLLVANPTAPNVATVTDGQGTSKITYNPKFLASIQADLGPAGTLGVFAHELGHHLEKTANHPSWMETVWDSELRADAWASCALAKVELRPSAVQAAVRALSTYPAATHPEWAARADVLRKGYASCGGGKSLPGALEAPGEQMIAAKDERKAEHKNDPAAPAGAGGCKSDRECRNGRVCDKGRCSVAPVAVRCGKDTDCPEPLECSGKGLCEKPDAAQAAETPAEAVPARLQEQHPAAAPNDSPTGATPGAEPDHKDACLRACDTGRARCTDIAVRETNQCVASVQAEASYRACSCPNYPDGNYACYRLCSTAYEQAKSCSTPDKARDCRIEGDRCRSRCR